MSFYVHLSIFLFIRFCTYELPYYHTPSVTTLSASLSTTNYFLIFKILYTCNLTRQRALFCCIQTSFCDDPALVEADDYSAELFASREEASFASREESSWFGFVSIGLEIKVWIKIKQNNSLLVTYANITTLV